ncbi:NAD(P)-binding domain-containing protein [Lactiplantibacillus plantarum subsp. plantarum]|uniref:NAD(P)-binding domain-containing protein n=1 Tax=Lactiplantibacillus plantarum TaxID=1590 RepID=UPI001FB229C1|nr:NAD(P)-binding domain-containing protein [Lactiplantibacillus plantarum]UOF05484.1 NAD(P)-binding domain-containing protein [Lactiplantibacillus plantarum subsp. plantarum]
MLKIGVIGLGNIAQKAYLPVMAAMQDQYEFHLTTRNPEKRAQLATMYGFQHTHATLEELMAVKPGGRICAYSHGHACSNHQAVVISWDSRLCR